MRMDVPAIDKELPCQTSSLLADFSLEGTKSMCQFLFLMHSWKKYWCENRNLADEGSGEAHQWHWDWSNRTGKKSKPTTDLEGLSSNLMLVMYCMVLITIYPFWLKIVYWSFIYWQHYKIPPQELSISTLPDAIVCRIAPRDEARVRLATNTLPQTPHRVGALCALGTPPFIAARDAL